MKYAPGAVPSDPEALSAFLQTELLKLQDVIDQIHLHEKYHVVPEKPQDGQVEFADGSNWDPGEGEGLYRYDASSDAWRWLENPGGAGLTSPLTTKGDVWGYDTGDERIPVGTNDQVLTADSTEALGVKWADAAAGGASPLTTKGDIFTYDSDDQRLPVGTEDQILSANPFKTPGLEWINPIKFGFVAGASGSATTSWGTLQSINFGKKGSVTDSDLYVIATADFVGSGGPSAGDYVEIAIKDSASGDGGGLTSGATYDGANVIRSSLTCMRKFTNLGAATHTIQLRAKTNNASAAGIDQQMILLEVRRTVL